MLHSYNTAAGNRDFRTSLNKNFFTFFLHFVYFG